MNKTYIVSYFDKWVKVHAEDKDRAKLLGIELFPLKYYNLKSLDTDDVTVKEEPESTGFLGEEEEFKNGVEWEFNLLTRYLGRIGLKEALDQRQDIDKLVREACEAYDC